jgi:hypothetical protein
MVLITFNVNRRLTDNGEVRTCFSPYHYEVLVKDAPVSFAL